MTAPLVLTISGHDPSGGAGIQADIEAIVAVGCRAASAVTCLTVQDTKNVHRVIATSAKILDDQIRTVLADMHVDALKIGLIPDLATLSVIAEVVADHPKVPVVLDPVLASGGGTRLTGNRLLDGLIEKLLPQVLLITPNSIEARRLGGCDQLNTCGERLLDIGCRAVLITGTHESDEQVIHRLHQRDTGMICSHWTRLPGSYHGSGCTLASSAAAFIAKGVGLEGAVQQALDYTWHSLCHGYQPGRGQLLPDRLYAIRQQEGSG